MSAKIKQRKNGGIYFTFKDYFYLALLVVCLSYGAFELVEHFISKDMLNEGKNIKIKAVVIDEINSHNSHQPQFDLTASYSYMFMVDGKTYKGDTHNRKLGVGDSVWVEYVPNHPVFSRPLGMKD